MEGVCCDNEIITKWIRMKPHASIVALWKQGFRQQAGKKICVKLPSACVAIPMIIIAVVGRTGGCVVGEALQLKLPNQLSYSLVGTSNPPLPANEKWHVENFANTIRRMV